MMIQLNEDLAQALDQQQGDTPLQAVHPTTGKIFFLVSEDQYQRLKPLFEVDPMTSEEQRFQLQQMGKRAGWDAPAMDDYDHYDANRS